MRAERPCTSSFIRVRIRCRLLSGSLAKVLEKRHDLELYQLLTSMCAFG